MTITNNRRHITCRLSTAETTEVEESNVNVDVSHDCKPKDLKQTASILEDLSELEKTIFPKKTV